MSSKASVPEKGIPIQVNTKWGRRTVGRVSGRTYEKQLKESGILHNPPAVALSLDELHQVKRSGAEFLRVVRTDLNETLSVSLADFDRYGFNVSRGFGEQVAVTLDHFSYTATMTERNPILDSPPIHAPQYERPTISQLPLFQPATRYDEYGNFKG